MMLGCKLNLKVLMDIIFIIESLNSFFI